MHPDAVVIGDVRIGPESTVWPTAVLRGDHGTIIIGARTSIQDGTVIHCTADLPDVIGDAASSGTTPTSRGAPIEAHCLDRAPARWCCTGSSCAAGRWSAPAALVPNDTEVPSRAMALGVPCKIREDAVADGAYQHAVDKYVHNGHWYRAELRRLD